VINDYIYCSIIVTFNLSKLRPGSGIEIASSHQDQTTYSACVVQAASHEVDSCYRHRSIRDPQRSEGPTINLTRESVHYSVRIMRGGLTTLVTFQRAFVRCLYMECELVKICNGDLKKSNKKNIFHSTTFCSSHLLLASSVVRARHLLLLNK
jgi:hypothetical protein